MNIDAKIQARLDKNITELLNAGYDTIKVRDLLSREQSFGKYDGCTPTAVHARAVEICRQLNAQIRQENNVIANAAIKSLREQFPDMAKYFRR